MDIASPRPVAISDENNSHEQKVMELNAALQTLRDQLAVVKDIRQDLKEGELLDSDSKSHRADELSDELAKLIAIARDEEREHGINSSKASSAWEAVQKTIMKAKDREHVVKPTATKKKKKNKEPFVDYFRESLVVVDDESIDAVFEAMKTIEDFTKNVEHVCQNGKGLKP